MSNLTKVEHRVPGADQHLYIATPAHTIYPNFHVSLLRNVLTLVGAGVSVTYAHLAGHCHVDDARNLLVADFLKTSCTDLLFWDADVATHHGGALKLLRHDIDVIGGAYPLKDGSGKFPVRLAKKPKYPLDSGCVIAESVPTGFLRIRRDVFVRLREHVPLCAMDGESNVPLIFGRTVTVEGQRVGGDVSFCRLLSETVGSVVHCDPSLLFTHCGTVDFAGRLADHLT